MQPAGGGPQFPVGPGGQFPNPPNLPGNVVRFPPQNVGPIQANIGNLVGVNAGQIQAQAQWVMNGPGRQVQIVNGRIFQIQPIPPNAPPPPPPPGGPPVPPGPGCGVGVITTAWSVGWPLAVAVAVAGLTVYVIDCQTHDECINVTVDQAGGWGAVLGFVPDANTQGNPNVISGSCTEATQNGLTAACWNAIGATETGYGNGIAGYYTCRDVYNRGLNQSSLWDSWQAAVNQCQGLVAACQQNTAAQCNLPAPPQLQVALAQAE
jgi:hypothetical protein